MLADALSKWLGETFLKLLMWVMLAMIAVGGVAAGVTYLIMK